MPSERYDYYLKQCKLHHSQSKTFSGNGVLKHARTLIAFSREIGATSALDYGCGKGLQYGKLVAFEGDDWLLEQHLGYTVAKYDPAVKGFHKPKPEPADLVWCTDVMEHIPEEDIPWVVSELLRLARRGLFVTVGTYPAKKHLPNGENAHVCLKPQEWWLEQFAPAFEREAAQPEAFTFKMLCE